MSEEKEVKTEEKPHENFSERVARVKTEARDKLEADAKKKDAPKYKMPDQMRKFALATLPLVNSEAYKAMCAMEDFRFIEEMGDPFSPPKNKDWFSSENYGEQMAFKKGFFIGLQLHRLDRERSWKSLMNEQEKEMKDGKDKND